MLRGYALSLSLVETILIVPHVRKILDGKTLDPYPHIPMRNTHLDDTVTLQRHLIMSMVDCFFSVDKYVQTQ